MERSGPPISSPLDWTLQDRLNYTRLSLQTTPPWPAAFISANTFCNACINITRQRRADEFNSIRQRNAYYDFISYILEYSTMPDRRCRDIKFFHATTVVTTWATLGAAESIVSSLAISSQTISILSEINRILLADNMYVIYCLLFTNVANFPFQFINNNPCVVNPQEITAFDFDLQMVRYEQSIVGNFIRDHSSRMTTAVVTEINDMLNSNGVALGIANRITGGISRTATQMAIGALRISDIDFLNFTHRTAIGFAAIHIFHRKTSDYTSYLQSIGYI